jgi:hypothetical protein
MASNAEASRNPVNSRGIGDFSQAADARRRADWALPMNQRLARAHALCKQMSAVKGVSAPRD